MVRDPYTTVPTGQDPVGYPTSPWAEERSNVYLETNLPAKTEDLTITCPCAATENLL